MAISRQTMIFKGKPATAQDLLKHYSETQGWDEERQKRIMLEFINDFTNIEQFSKHMKAETTRYMIRRDSKKR